MTRRVHPKHDVLWLKKNSAAVRPSACCGVAVDFCLCLAPWVCSRSRCPRQYIYSGTPARMAATRDGVPGDDTCSVCQTGNLAYRQHHPRALSPGGTPGRSDADRGATDSLPNCIPTSSPLQSLTCCASAPNSRSCISPFSACHYRALPISTSLRQRRIDFLLGLRPPVKRTEGRN